MSAFTNALKHIGTNLANVLGFSTVANDIGRLFGKQGSGYSGFEDYLHRVGILKESNSGVTENSESSGSSNPIVTVNSDGSTSADLSNINLTNLDQAGIIGLEAVTGAIPEIQRMWNSAEAEKERNWQTEMSNSAYQRAVNDMSAAGINPILAYTQGGATSGFGASASGMVSSGNSLGSTLHGVSSLIKTVMKEDRKDDVQAANMATNLVSPHSARYASSVHDRFRNR